MSKRARNALNAFSHVRTDGTLIAQIATPGEPARTKSSTTDEWRFPAQVTM